MPRSASTVLAEVFGYSEFRPGQEQIVSALAAGKHVLAVMPTGSGKSLCFQLPALMKDGLAIVVSPLVALMQNQVAALKLAGAPAEAIHGNNDRDTNVAIWHRVRRGELRLLYLSPERLMDPRMIEALGRLPLSLIAVDEAHCMSQWGPSFRPEYDLLANLRQYFPGVPIGAFTATADELTRADILEKLFGGAAQVFVHGFDRPNIRLAVAPKKDASRQMREFLERHKGESGIIYCLSRAKTEEVAADLSRHGIRALPYHAGMEKDVREENQNIFMTEPAVVMVATIAFGMGIDKPDVRFVLHADLPGSPEAYYQEIGRAGRDGAPAEALMLFGLNDIRLRRRFIEEEDAGEDRRRRELRRLEALVTYCEAPACRRVALLAYFGEKHGPCGNCDSCLEGGAASVDGTAEAIRILAAVRDTGNRFGAHHLADVLAGLASEKIVNLGHDRLDSFGAGRERARADWLALIRKLTGAGLLVMDMAGHGGLQMSADGRRLLNGEGSFSYRPDPRTAAKPSRRERSAPVPPIDESAVDHGLLARLKSLRLQLAKERSVPAYVIFSDRTLMDMAARAPKSTAEFACVHGVGEAKLREFADVFLREIIPQ